MKYLCHDITISITIIIDGFNYWLNFCCIFFFLFFFFLLALSYFSFSLSNFVCLTLPRFTLFSFFWLTINMMHHFLHMIFHIWCFNFLWFVPLLSNLRFFFSFFLLLYFIYSFLSCKFIILFFLLLFSIFLISWIQIILDFVNSILSFLLFIIFISVIVSVWILLWCRILFFSAFSF